jgi:hypothetical protein
MLLLETGYFTTTPVARETVLRRVVERQKKEVIVSSRHCSRIRLEGLGNTTRNLIQDNRVPVEIRTEHVPNTSPERYRYARLFCTLRYVKPATV